MNTQKTHGELVEDCKDDEFIASFKVIQQRVNKTAHEKGWYDSPIKNFLSAYQADIGEVEILPMLIELQNLEDSRRIALIHSEASEALENVRHGFTPDDKIPEFSGVEAEFADVIIRIMDMSQERGFRVAEAILAKAKYNSTRSYRHGNKTC